jgi:hypothetical protein
MGLIRRLKAQRAYITAELAETAEISIPQFLNSSISQYDPPKKA